MRKFAMFTMGAALLLSSCGTYTGTGAYAGASLGGMIGSAVGGISGGWRGSDVGTLIGMAGGAAVGAAIGAAADQERADYRNARTTYEDRPRYDRDRYERGNDGYYNQDNSGDDRIDFQSGSGNSNITSEVASDLGLSAERDGISVSNVRFISNDGDGSSIRPGEICKLSFEIRNTSPRTLYNVAPQVVETSRNRHIQVSQGISVERIEPGNGIRYTAMISADHRLRNGKAVFKIQVYNPVTNHSVEIDGIKIMTRE